MIEFLPYIAGQITQPFNLVLMFGATVIGLIFGAIPGLSGTLAVMLFMPLTYTMNASSAVVFLIALWVGGCSGAFIGSVLLGIPGSASAVATCFDGYPMAQAGKAGKALAIGMVASFLGTFFSAILGGPVKPENSRYCLCPGSVGVFFTLLRGYNHGIGHFQG